MDREKYERTELEIIKFQTEDVITTSQTPYENDETSRVNNKNHFIPLLRQGDSFCTIIRRKTFQRAKKTFAKTS